MGQRINLTQAVVARMEPPTKGRVSVHDAKARGLTLTITSTGTKSFYLYRRVKGKPSRIFLGRHPDMSVELARERAVATYAEIIGGADPNEKKRTERRGGITLGEVFDHWVQSLQSARLCGEIDQFWLVAP